AAVSELWLRAPTREDLAFARSPELVTTRNFFLAVDRALKTLAPLSWRGLRRRAVARAIEWVLRHQDTNGQWGGIQPAMVNSVLALHAVGFAADHPTMVSGIQGVEDFLVECEGTLMYQPCVSPNWDTALAAGDCLRAQLDARHAEPQRRLGRLRHRQHGRVPQPYPVRRHGGDDRSADRGRDRTRAAPDGHRRLPARLRTRPAGRRVPAPHAAQRRELVGAVGRQLHLRDLERARRARADRRGHASALRAARRRLAHHAPEPRRRLGRDGGLVRRRIARREGREYAVTDRVVPT